MTGENQPVEDLTEPSAQGRADRRRVTVVTGASSGIGLAAAIALSIRGDEVVLVGRDPARLAAAADDVAQVSGEPPATFRADFAVLDDVRTLAGELRAAYDRIDVLANNAGAILMRPMTTVDGFELTMQANHLAPFLLTCLLRDRVGRVVVTASAAHRSGALDPADLSRQLAGYRAMRAYGTSKQANILFAAEAARRWPALLTTSFHPGVVRTRFASDSTFVALGMKLAPFLRTPAQGAQTLVWLAEQDARGLTNGGYYVNRRLRAPLAKAADPQLAARLWEASERAVGLS
ncbi:SDR family NAD(P)-dependent oxidoreductase [Micromonospora sp. NPDC049679]|uniref:SDR family NAD(P)-dependent oxidoreductase n=1 Tax=Micromonospora sp. NPDC049679 TaxID=3155920 RepID=UPI0033E82454